MKLYMRLTTYEEFSVDSYTRFIDFGLVTKPWPYKISNIGTEIPDIKRIEIVVHETVKVKISWRNDIRRLSWLSSKNRKLRQSTYGDPRTTYHTYLHPHELNVTDPTLCKWRIESVRWVLIE